MPFSSSHMPWLVDTGERLYTKDGKEIKVFEFNHQDDPKILKDWVKHFRNHYCLDHEIDILRDGTGYSRKEYLENIKFPDIKNAPGPSIRAGDFGEILAADFLEFNCGFWVPRTRYSEKDIRNESSKGVDTIGFKIINQGQNSADDMLVVIESKAKFTAPANNTVQVAIDASGKDVLRKAESLNSMKQHFLNRQDMVSVAKVQRFQNESDRPYKQLYGAIAHLDHSTYNAELLEESDTGQHPHHANLSLFVIKGVGMMNLVHELYRSAADEA